LLHQVTEQEPDLVTAKLRDELSQSGIMALGHRVSPFESTADELAEDSTVAPSDHGSTYTTRWDAYQTQACRAVAAVVGRRSPRQWTSGWWGVGEGGAVGSDELGVGGGA